MNSHNIHGKPGVKMQFRTGLVSPEEMADMKRLVDEGWSIKKIAKEMGRSQECVARRIGRNKMRNNDFPVPDTDEYRALDGRLYEDVSQDALNRECSPDRPPMNGAAASAYVRRVEWPSQSAASLCVG